MGRADNDPARAGRRLPGAVGGGFFAHCHPLDMYLDTPVRGRADDPIRGHDRRALRLRAWAGNVETETRAALSAYEERAYAWRTVSRLPTVPRFVYGEDDAFSIPCRISWHAPPIRARGASADRHRCLRTARWALEENASSSEVRLLLAPAGPQWCSDNLLRRVAGAARSLAVGVQAHCLESAVSALDRFLVLRDENRSPPRANGSARCYDLAGALSLAHSVRDRSLRRTGTSIAHNPSSNLRLRVGIAPVNEMLAAGVNVAVGTDGMALADDEGMLGRATVGDEVVRAARRVARIRLAELDRGALHGDRQRRRTDDLRKIRVGVSSRADELTCRARLRDIKGPFFTRASPLSTR